MNEADKLAVILHLAACEDCRLAAFARMHHRPVDRLRSRLRRRVRS